MNYVFISPNFPENYYNFCQGLKNNGVNVLGIGDAPYESLNKELKNALTDYIQVSTLESLKEKETAIKKFIKKYGNIDYIESNNEYWLESDAKLRTIFGIETGPKTDYIEYFKHKSKMKERYIDAGVKVARYLLLDSLENAEKFIDEVSYPVVVKPDNGVGANATFKLNNREELLNFFNNYSVKGYIMEEFINGELVSFDGVCNSKSEVVYYAHHVFPTPIMDVVNDSSEIFYYTNKLIPENLIDAGKRVIKAFNAKSRFFHLEFFILREDKIGLGCKGDIIGLEVNMRSPGGFTPDMINHSHNINIYQIWADVMVFDECRQYIEDKKYYCVNIGRRFNVKYKNNYDEIISKYGDKIVMYKKMPAILADAMGDYFYIGKFDNEDELKDFQHFLLERC